MFQDRTPMHRDVFGLQTLDLVLRIIFAGTMSVTLVISILCMDLDDRAADMTGFRIPGHVIADFETFRLMILRSRSELAVPAPPRF
jgi:hypothetical protein